jgi:hypothetical protein
VPPAKSEGEGERIDQKAIVECKAENPQKILLMLLISGFGRGRELLSKRPVQRLAVATGNCWRQLSTVLVYGQNFQEYHVKPNTEYM